MGDKVSEAFGLIFAGFGYSPLPLLVLLSAMTIVFDLSLGAV